MRVPSRNIASDLYRAREWNDRHIVFYLSDIELMLSHHTIQIQESSIDLISGDFECG